MNQITEKNEIVELTAVETEQVEGGFIPVLWGVAAVVSYGVGYGIGSAGVAIARRLR